MSRKTKTNHRHTLRIFYYFWQTLMRHKIRTLILFLVVPVYVYVSTIIVPQLLSDIIGQLSTGDTDFSHYISLLTAIAIALIFANIIMLRAIDWLDWSLDARGSYYLNSLVFHKLVYASDDFHKNHFSGSLVSQSSKLSSAFINLKSSLVWDLLPLILNVIFATITSFFISPPFATILLAYIVIFTTISTLIFTKTRHHEIAWTDSDNRCTGQLSDSISNATAVKSYANELFEEHRFAKTNRANSRAIIGLAKTSAIRNSILNIINVVFFIIFVIMLVNAPSLFGLTTANIVLLYSLTNSLTNRIWNISNILRIFNRSLSDAKAMVEILDTPNAVADNSSAKTLSIHDASIDFHNIHFQHPEESAPLFQNFSLKIHAGERIGLVGASGSGKSTLTKLLLRFSDVNSGNILIDGQDIASVTQSSLRQNIAYVPQDTILFHRSLAENIAYGKPNASKDEIIHAAKLANAHNFIVNLPKGYNTLAGERGSKLSGGQRQRIAIARAILKNAPILILDEATSALDTESERLIQDALEKLMKNRTSLIIAHRLSTVSRLDRIIVLKDGKIVEQGTHRQLLLKDGLYQKLWSAQGGALLDSEDNQTSKIE